ncbi:2-C-methyl-D-erythritol 4-phosphate cytidylyltransferase [Xanthomonas cannabis]|uniref:2-C-methyl-D-erythritol 4-phosphate cytidylyltransferase n=1 Tax=Xanthomonas cannabis TaxID=1885674 RepID=UPI00141AAA2D|nr:2-C-methyl-D-erythritol 4-phosphate cytidylyltransferase [Xanthomonas cannabis]NIK01549.1 2-C-methyl-D-erythritol 4-phosphate cytidylyltransferase [Xanthomonas cannabis]NIK62662.1 2-C-methyl-D-erythritol 4-phosphate cytidylyltransferase [Xanthomonas cannabis]
MTGSIWAIVPAAGRGTRFGGPVPKQYLPAGGQPLMAYTLAALAAHPAVAGILVAIAPGDADWPGWTAVESTPVLTCVGGATRAASVLAGLLALPESVRADDFVLVHDAARPNLALADLDRLLEIGRGDPVGAILAAPVRDTLKRAGDDGGIDGTEPRERLWRALTPQLFRRHQLIRGLTEASAAGVEVTDEAMAMERLGLRPLLVEGAEDNFKVTTPTDLARFEFELARRDPEPWSRDPDSRGPASTVLASAVPGPGSWVPGPEEV